MYQNFTLLKYTLFILITLLLISCIDKSDSPTQNSGIPAAPQKLQAVADLDGFRLNWQAPESNINVTYYIIERAFLATTVAALNFEVIEANFTSTTLEFTEPFPSDIAEEKFFYRITAGNSVGNSQPVRSDVVARNEFFPISDVSTQVLLPSTLADGIFFSTSLAMSANGNTMAVGNRKKVFIYERDLLGKWQNQPAAVLEDKSGANLAGLDQSLAMTTDGSTLAVYYSDTINNTIIPAVHLYVRNNTGAWDTTPTQIITSPDTKNVTVFGYKLVFSPDGQNLAISDLHGQVYIYSKNTDGSWQNTANTILRSQETINGGGYYFPVAFSPDGSTLAMSDTNTKSGETYPAGSVKLFKKQTDGLWSNVPFLELFSNKPDLNFGINVVFSHDGNTLAISEHSGNIRGQQYSIHGTATVQLFTKDSSGNWNTTPSTVFTSRALDKRFGYSMAFNANDDVMAIAEKNGSILFNDRGIYNTGTVQLFKKDNVGNWITTPQSILASNNPATGNAFGYSMAFGLDNTLVVGELRGARFRSIDVGAVHIFDTSMLN